MSAPHRYVVELDDGTTYEVEIDPSRPDTVRVNGAEKAVHLDPLPTGEIAASVGSAKTKLRLEAQEGQLFVETSDGSRRSVRVESKVANEWRAAISATPPAAPLEAAPELSSPIAGSITALLVAEGDPVRAGDPVLTIEAMKMENTLSAPRTGFIHFHVAPGDSVRAGHLLASVSSTS